MDDVKANSRVDLCGTVCPFSLMTALNKIKEAERGNVVEIIIEDDESLANISKSVKNEGHKILKLQTKDGQNPNYKLFVQKA
ncbi:MAG: sulfurtransferase TusA family protein [Candidatus Micrarchaeia archaeon]